MEMFYIKIEIGFKKPLCYNTEISELSCIYYQQTTNNIVHVWRYTSFFETFIHIFPDKTDSKKHKVKFKFELSLKNFPMLRIRAHKFP